MSEHTDEGTQEQGKTMKRRGILAAAGTVVAGILAKQAAQPVAAGTDGDLLAAKNTFTYGTTVVSGHEPGVPNLIPYGFGGDVVFTGDAGTLPDINLGTGRPYDVDGVKGIGKGAGSGVVGLGGGDTATNPTGFPIGVRGSVLDTGFGVYGNAGNGSGVYGIATGGVGVYGTSGGNGVVGLTTAPANSGYAAIYGGSNGVGNIGVFGDGAGGVGVQGQSNAAGGTGVQGVSGSGFPIIGKVTGTGSATNTAAGVLGAGTKGPGVQGQSTGGHGLVGTTDASDGHAGLVGNANNAGGVGLIAIAPGYGTMTVGQAGIFYGNLKVNGTTSAPVMQAEVKHQGDNTHRLLYSDTSTEAWCADYGNGTFAGGKADITLDPDFAALVDTSTLHVFLTPHTPDHLHVPMQTATGFTVVATPSGAAQMGGPKRAEGVGTFSYRVVAKRKDIGSERLAKVAAPTSPKIPTAFTIKETPEVKPPTTTP